MERESEKGSLTITQTVYAIYITVNRIQLSSKTLESAL